MPGRTGDRKPTRPNLRKDFPRRSGACHTRLRDRAGALLLFLRLPESGSRRSRLIAKPTDAPGSEARGVRVPGAGAPNPTVKERREMAAVTMDQQQTTP